jgi:hypothetical protein
MQGAKIMLIEVAVVILVFVVLVALGVIRIVNQPTEGGSPPPSALSVRAESTP